ncbi:uncharacterized protein LOC118437623 [Folsomia candida]|uniref:uncharacterized protein LOC118437623 n=1 Tax=Folsomia candida TaxID=158441 RepID=UPI0016055446|nr:uncharacterized protein LOC118437623 [Folsomia candida]
MSRTPNLSRTTTTTTLSDSSLSRRSSGSFSRASASAASVSSVSSTSFTTLFARDEEEDQEIGDDTLSEESLDSESEGSLESFTEGSLENPIRGSSQESLPCSSQGSLPSSSQDSLDGPISPTVSKTMIRAAIDKVAAKRLTERGVPRACYTPKWISNKTERNTQLFRYRRPDGVVGVTLQTEDEGLDEIPTRRVFTGAKEVRKVGGCPYGSIFRTLEAQSGSA